MKVLHLATGPGFGGATNVAVALTESLRNQRCQLVLASPLHHLGLTNDVDIYRLRQFPLHDPFYSYGVAFLNRKAIQRALVQERPEVVLVHGPVVSLGYLVDTNTPIVSIVHGTYRNEVRWMWHHPIMGIQRARYIASIGLTYRLDAQVYEHSSTLPNAFLVGVCDATCDELTSVGARRSKAKSILNGVNKTVFRQFDKDNSRSLVGRRFNLPVRNRLILTLGPSPRKGTHILIRAVSLLRRRFSKDFTVLIVGEGQEGYMKHLRRLVKAYGLEKNIQFAGFVPTDDLPLLYKSADVTVAPSFSEGAALSVPESLACGIPVVATRVGGNEQYLRRAGLEDLLVDINQYDFSPWLAEGIENALEQKRKVNIEGIPSWEDVAAEYLSYFHSIVGR